MSTDGRMRLDFLALVLPFGLACGPGTGKNDAGDESGASGSGDATDGSGTAGTSTESETGSTESTCVAYANKVRECEGAADYSDFEMYCEALLAEYASYYGPGCADAYEDYFACLSTQTCDVLLNGEGFCQDEALVLAQQCGGDTGDDPGGTATGGTDPNPTTSG